MKRWLWIAAAALGVLWSFVAWGVYALIGAVGGVLAENADLASAHPETVVWLSWLVKLATNAGLIGTLTVWAIGLAAIALLSFLLAKVRQPRHLAGRSRCEPLPWT